MTGICAKETAGVDVKRAFLGKPYRSCVVRKAEVPMILSKNDRVVLMPDPADKRTPRTRKNSPARKPSRPETASA
jgi:hypothetical protein